MPHARSYGRKTSTKKICANTLLFTSSIAVRALASLLTASILNLFLSPYEPSLAARVRAEDATTRPSF
jgi:hypothetical protein